MGKRREEEPKKPRRKQPGIKINNDLWIGVKVLAAKKERTATELVEQAIREFLQRHGKDKEGNVV
jgi:predicted transcriptional regulator